MFYSNPEPLDKKKHQNFKLQKQDSYAFAEDTNSIPVAGFEFFEASRSFPIFFVKNKKEDYLPIAILSLKKKGHDLGKTWQDAYVPAYVRRYPFILSSDGMVLFDRDAPHVQENEGDALFNDDGEPSDITKDIVQFLQTVDKGYRMTEDFCKLLAEKEIFQPFNGKIKFAEGSINLGDLYAISEKKLHEALNDEEIAEWFKKGWLAWCHAHLHSIGSMNEIFKRARAAGEPIAAPEAVAEQAVETENNV